MSKSKVIINDKGYEKIIKNDMRLDGKKIKIGLFGDGQPDKNLAYRGAIQEFGIPEGITVTEKMRNYLHFIGIHLAPETTKIYIPARPFMRQAWEGTKDNLNKTIDEMYNGLLTRSVDWFLNKIGEVHKKHIQNTIKNGAFEKNSSATLQLKNGSTPLINTGEMHDGVKWEVE